MKFVEIHFFFNFKDHHQLSVYAEICIFVENKAKKNMKTMVIKLKDDAELQLLSGMLKKMRIQSKLLTTDDMEDIGLGEMMLKVDRSEKVSRELIMSKLGGE